MFKHPLGSRAEVDPHDMGENARWMAHCDH